MEANAWVAAFAATLEAPLLAAEEEFEAPSPVNEKGLCVRDMEPDGNCLFRSISDQVFGNPELHNRVGEVEKKKDTGGIGVAKRRYSSVGWGKRC
jgi:hypothetical protein